MAIIINEGFDVNSPATIDKRLLVDRVDGTTASLVSLTPQYNYANMYVWVKEEKAFYYLNDTVYDNDNPGATVSDWTLWSAGGGTVSCTKSGYVSGSAFTANGQIATASVVFASPYSGASYSVAITGLTNQNTTGYADYVWSVNNIQNTGFVIQVDVGTVPLGATAMWITNCWEGSNDIGGGGGPAASVEIDLEEIAFGTGTGITSSNLFTFDVSNTNLNFGKNSINNDTLNSAIIAGTGSRISGLKTLDPGTSSNSIISAGCNNYIFRGFESSIIAGFNNSMTASYNSIISGGYCNEIRFGLGSSIIGGKYNSIDTTPNSSIIAGQNNTIFCGISAGLGRAVIIGGADNSIACKSQGSLILGGNQNIITQSSVNSAIQISKCSYIYASNNSGIIASTSSIITFRPKVGFVSQLSSSNSLILGGSGHCIKGAQNSVIIGGQNRLICGFPALTVTGENDGFDNAVALPSIMGCASLALGIATSSTNGIILNDNYFTLIAYPPEPSGTMDVCLPSVSSYIIGRIYVIKKNGSSTQSTVNVCPYGSNCIDGYAGYVELINPWDYYMLQADGVDNWIKLGGAVGLNL